MRIAPADGTSLIRGDQEPPEKTSASRRFASAQTLQ
jgi:hypothetical protein